MRLHGSTSAELREHFLRWYFVPLAHQLLHQPGVQSVILAVAQYWDDEASDAVHHAVRASRSLKPTWPVAERVGDLAAAHRALYGQSYAPMYGDNYDMIVAFAAYCRPHCHQEMSEDEAYRPYAVARRSAQGEAVSVEVVGKIQQAGWEDRFLAPSRALRVMSHAPLISRVERARDGQPIPVSVLLEALEGPAQLSEGLGLGWAVLEAARRRLEGGDAHAETRITKQLGAWLERLGVSS